MRQYSRFTEVKDTLGELFRERGTEIKAEPNSTIAAQGSASDTIFRVMRGCVRVCAYTVDGDRRILQFLAPGDYLGLEDVDTCSTAREAVDMVVLKAIPRPVFEAELARCPRMQASVRMNLAKEIDAQTELLMLTGQTSAVERVKMFLEHYAGLRSSTGFIALPMCRRDIADHLGLSMETVSRAFSTLKMRGEIALRGSNFFRPVCPQAEREAA